MALDGPALGCVEDVRAGDGLPTLTTPPLTTLHLVRWSAAIEGWHRINFDQRFAVEHDGLPELPINGSFKRQLLAQYLTRVLGASGWLAEFECRLRHMSLVGDRLTAWATVRAVTVGDAGYGELDLEVGLRDQDGVETTPGRARGVLPTRGGRVPYPWPG